MLSTRKLTGTGEQPIDVFYSWDSLIKKYSVAYNVPFEWVKAIMMNESALGQDARVRSGIENPIDLISSVSSDGKSYGLMQLTLGTARMFESTVTEVALNDPENSVRLGVKYMAWLMKKKNGNQEGVVRGYNGGAGYLNTVAGRRDTPEYYSRFLRNLDVIRAKNTA